jgi:Peptidase MA superfamily
MSLRAAVVALLLFCGSIARADLDLPVSRETARVSIRGEAGLDDQVTRLAERAEADLARIEATLGPLAKADKIDVRVVKRVTSLADAAPPGYGAPEWAAGVAYPRLGVIVVAIRDRKGGFLDVQSTLAHELAHVALERALGKGVATRWLTEGFAYAHSADFSLARAQTMFGAVVGRKLLPLWQLEASFPAEENEASLAYAQSYDFVAFLLTRGRHQDRQDDGDRQPFRFFLANLAAGQTYDAAALDAYGRTLLQLEDEWLAGVRDRYLWMPVGLGSAALWVFGALLVVLAWRRRRAQGRLRLAQWELEERLAAEAAAREAEAAVRAAADADGPRPDDGRLWN